MDTPIYVQPVTAIPFPLPSYGIVQQLKVDPEAIKDHNLPCLHHYACVRKSTGLAAAPSEIADDTDILNYGPFMWLAGPAMVYDTGLILQQNRCFVGNFRPLARCVMAVIQNRTGDGSFSLDPGLMMLYGSCIMDAVATHIILKWDEMVRLWDQFLLPTFFATGRLVNTDFENNYEEQWARLASLRDEIVKAYEEKAWPEEVWPGFLALLGLQAGLDPPAPPGTGAVPPELRPACFQVLIGEKAIEEQVAIALPDKPVVEFRMPYAEDLCRLVEDQLGKLRVPGIFNTHIFFIKMLIFVLGRHFDNLSAETKIKPTHRASLFARYAGHIVDALRDSILYNKVGNGFHILKKTYPTILQYPNTEYFDGVNGSDRNEAMVAAFDEIVAAYNNRQWPVNVWWHLLETLNCSNPDLVSGSFVKMYDDSCGGGIRSLSTHVQFILPKGEPWTKPKEDEDEVYVPEGDDEIDVGDDDCPLDDCFKNIEDCCNCVGPSSVSYTLRWLCKSEHMKEGVKEETFGPFGVMSGDCASRIHDEVNKVFPFATGFKSSLSDPKYMAPNFVVGSCLHFENPIVTPMEYDNGYWKPSQK